VATVTRLIAADPTSTALLVAARTQVAPRRGATSFAVRIDVEGQPAWLIFDAASPLGTTRATLTVAGPAWCAAAFLASLADAAEARADAA